ncbi:MAG TPA: hypothetical protein VIX86_10945 [Streptosporangiaceae bacterium]
MLLVLLAVALLGPAVAAALTALVHALIIAAAVLLGLAAGGLVAYGAYRLRQRRPEPPRVVHRITPAVPWRSEPLPGTRAAIAPAQEVHLHFHGVDAEDIAAAIRHQQDDRL